MPNAESRQNGILISHFDRLFVDFQIAIEGTEGGKARLVGYITHGHFRVFLYQFFGVGNALAVNQFAESHAHLLVDGLIDVGTIGL